MVVYVMFRCFNLFMQWIVFLYISRKQYEIWIVSKLDLYYPLEIGIACHNDNLIYQGISLLY